MYKISVSVMHHPDRVDLLPNITSQIPDAGIVYSSGLGLSEVWATARAAWRLRPADATHHLVLQDDVLLCKDFIRTVERIVRLKPDALLGFYHNKIQADEILIEQDIRWIKDAGAITAQALLMPTNKIDEFLHWEKQFVNPEYPHDDGRLCLWIYKTKSVECWFCLPTLVEHIAPSDSVVGQGNKHKISRWFVGINRSGLYYDWTLGINNPLRTSVGYPSANTKAAYVP